MKCAGRGGEKMKSPWKVTSNPIAGKKIYSCYRIKDETAVDHSGNREELGKWYDTEEEARAAADALNKASEA